MFLCKNYQYTESSKLIDSKITKNFNDVSLEDLIIHQNILKSSIGTYLVASNDEQMCFLLLSNDKKLANKLKIKNEYDKYTNDMFPINYNEMYIKDILKKDSETTINIKHNEDNYFLVLAKGDLASEMFCIIENYKKKSYLMQNYWKQKKQKAL